jgi:hypothetical protein
VQSLSTSEAYQLSANVGEINSDGDGESGGGTGTKKEQYRY